MKYMVLMASIFMFLFKVQADPAKIDFKKGDETVRSVDVDGMEKLGSEKTLKVWEPHEDKDVTYKGYSLVEVLNKVYGEQWKKNDLVVFVCADGYKSPIPRASIEANEAVLAYAKTKGSFTVNNRFQNEDNVKLGPLYLVWNNINNEQLKAEEANHWPYQIVGIELSNFAERYPHMIPPAGSSENVKNGFQDFQKYCMSCHKVNGDGGDKGPELNTPLSVTEKLNAKDMLTQFIDNPSSWKPGSTMPGLNKNIPNRDEVISDTISYLTEMAKHKTTKTSRIRRLQIEKYVHSKEN